MNDINRDVSKKVLSLISSEKEYFPIKDYKGYVTTPGFTNYSYSNVRKRILDIGFDVIRSIAYKVPIVAAIINLRCDQIRQYCTPVAEQRWEGLKGFYIERIDGKEELSDLDVRNKEILIKFILNTGITNDEDREDTFSDYVQKLVREVMTIDQVVTEVQRTMGGRVCAFRIIDGATILRVDIYKENANKTLIYNDYMERGIRYVQEVEGQIMAEFKNSDVIFDYMNRRADIDKSLEGYSYVEQCIDIITYFLFGMQYNNSQFQFDKAPRGFITIPGVDAQGIQLLEEYWKETISGSGGRWKIPFIGTSTGETKSPQWNAMGSSNKDMEYHKYMMLLGTFIGAIMGCDLAELGIKTDDSQALIGENSAPRLEQSKDRGLSSVLSFVESHINKLLSMITKEYCFKFTPLSVEDKEKSLRVEREEMSGYKSINDIRKSRGMEDYKLEMGGVNIYNVPGIMSPTIQQLITTKIQMQQQKEQQESMGGFGGGMEQGGQEGDGGGVPASELMGKSIKEKVLIEVR